MADLILPKISRKENCNLCLEGALPKSTIGERSVIVTKTGDNPDTDWFLTLQRNLTSDPLTGFGFMLIPVGHLECFAQIHSNEYLAKNFGKLMGLVQYAMQVVRAEEWKRQDAIFTPSSVVYGKCATAINTQTHIHFKTYTFDGDIAQAFPSDTDWLKEAPRPVAKNKLAQERYESLGRRLIDLCNS